MARFLTAALVALLGLLCARDAAAFIPCETSTRYLCSGKCQALASDSPEWAEVQVCGDSPSAAATDAVYELLLQWECAILDEGDPGPQDDLSCYECSEEHCHPQGGLLPDGSPANQGGLLGGIDWTNPGGLLGDLGAEVATCLLGEPDCVLTPTPEQCAEGCSYYCITAGYGYEEHYGTEGLWIYNNVVDVACPGSSALAEAAIIAEASQHGLSVSTETTTCASLELQLQLCEPNGSEPTDGPTQKLCRWSCAGFSNPHMPRHFLTTSFISPCDETDTAEAFAYDHWNTTERDKEWWLQLVAEGIWPTWEPVIYQTHYTCIVTAEL